MKKITKLTPEQIARFPEWTKKWIDIGLSTEPANFDSATAAALKGYELANLKKPMVILRMGSPYGAVLGGVMAWAALKEFFKKNSKVRAQVRAQVRDQVRAQVRAQVGDSIYNSMGGSIYGAGWCSYVSFFRYVMGWENDALSRHKVYESLTNNCGWTWWHENVLAISDRPSEIHLDQQGRLHAEKGPSIAYRDGWSLYHWHGVVIQKEWVTGYPPSAKDALTWGNIEQRRAACEIVGWKNILAQLNAKVIDEDGDDEIGTLIEAELPDSGKERFLKVMCGTKREFCIPVPREMKTAIQASAWTYGIDELKSYKPEVRT